MRELRYNPSMVKQVANWINGAKLGVTILVLLGGYISGALAMEYKTQLRLARIEGMLTNLCEQSVSKGELALTLAQLQALNGPNFQVPNLAEIFSLGGKD